MNTSSPSRWRTVLFVALAFSVGTLFGALVFGGPSPSAVPAQRAEGDHAAEVWTCAMHPQIRLPEAGQCPICFMDLIPATAPTGGESPTALVLTEAAKALAEVRTAPVRRGEAAREVALVGRVTYDETLVQRVSSTVPGRIERLYVEVTGTRVKKGEHMLRIYSPELFAAQREWLEALATAEKMPPGSAAKSVLEKTASGAYERLRLWGLSESQLNRIRASNTAQERITLYAPRGGVVVERNVIAGAYVDEGTPLYTVAELERLWVELNAYESDLPHIRFGQVVELNTDALPGRAWQGRVAFVSPIVDEASRTVRVRINFDNEDGALKPGMLVRAVLRATVDAQGVAVSDDGIEDLYVCPMHPDVVKDHPGRCDICGMSLQKASALGLVNVHDALEPLLIPATAPLLTGKRAVVYVEQPGQSQPTYEGRTVVLGPRVGTEYVVLEGLAEGERVVVQGAFKLDAAMQVQARPSMMQGGLAASMPSDPPSVPLRAVEAERWRDILAAYGAIEEALTQSALAAAQTAADRLRRAMPSSGEPLFALLQSEADALTQGAAALQHASTLGDARILFASLSATLIEAVRRLGVPDGVVAHAFFCPMANDNQGAPWIESAAELTNPYFGDAMLRCGTAEPALPRAVIQQSTPPVSFRPGQAPAGALSPRRPGPASQPASQPSSRPASPPPTGHNH